MTTSVYRGVLDGEIAHDDLSARRLCRYLGKTTGALYHHYGSLDRLLFEVSQLAYEDLRAQLEAAFAAHRDLGDVAVAFVEFGLDNPELYPLMFERRDDYAALRDGGAFDRTIESALMLDAVGLMLAEAGSDDVAMDGRLFFAGLHGLVSLAASGRANVRALDRTDRDVACDTARALAERILKTTPP
ncbi:MAG: TetR/AcrR family transcriptional regulator [Polyangiaceae bacterium]